jgi:hypothetical protein
VAATLSIAASFPLLFTDLRSEPVSEPMTMIVRDSRVIALGVLVFIFFAVTMGRGIH